MMNRLWMLVWCVCMVRAEHKLYTSVSHLRELWQSEKNIIKQLDQVQQVLTDVTSVINSYIEEFRSSQLENEVVDFLNNPLHSYALLRHVSLGWHSLEQSMDKLKTLEPTVDKLRGRSSAEMVPDFSDLDGAAEALILLQEMYDLNATSLIMDGRIETHFNNLNEPSLLPGLTVWDGVKLGLDATNNNNFYSGISYLNAARLKFVSEGQFTKPHFADNTLTLEQVDNFISTAKLIHDRILIRKGPRSFSHKTFSIPFNPDAKKKVKKDLENLPIYLRDDLEALESKDKNYQQKKETLVITSQYKKLCQGVPLLNPNMTSNLYSHYVHNNHPWLKIGPLKVTVYSLDPYIVRFNQLLYPSECQSIKDFMSTRLHIPSGKVNPKSAKNDWTMKHAWPSEDDNKALEMLGLRIEAATGARTKSDLYSEPFMVGNYGMGGNYDVHTDFNGQANFQTQHGDRIATVMAYLSDVKAGGATVFPYLGLTSWPDMGSALMWWNMLKSGQYDYYTRHGACPVLLGEKWIGNKWIGYNGQWDVMKCTTNIFDKIQSPIM